MSRPRRLAVLSLGVALVHACVTTPAAGSPAPPLIEAPLVTPAPAGEELGARGHAPLFVAPTPVDLWRGFDPPEHTWLAGHRGVDLRVKEGDPVHAAGAGVVAFVGVVVDRPLVSIDHPVGIRTTYEPVSSTLRAGDTVAPGALLGHLAPGNGHCAVDCLHWGARIGRDTYIDPLRLLQPYRIRLYPPVPWDDVTRGGVLG